MALQTIEKRVEKLEASLRVGEKPQTVEDMFDAMERGEYGPCTLMSLCASILANGGSGEHLRGELPDVLIDYSVERLKEGRTEKTTDDK